MATSSTSSSSQHWSYFLSGLDQAFNWPKTLILFYSSSTVQQSMLKIFVINGIVYLGGLVIIESFYNTASHRLFGYSYAGLYGYPMYFLLLALNGTFYNPIAEKAYQVQLARTNKTGAAGNTNGLVNAVQSMAETIYTILFYISCGVFATFLYSIPYIGIFLSFFMNCAIMSYYCFEYKWGYLGWTLEQRLTYLENHWAFFLGFGVPSTLLTFFLSTLYSGAIFALIYPSYVIMATMATAQPISSHSQPIASGHAARKEWNLPKKVPIFYPVRKMLDVVILVVRLVGGVHADSIVSEKKKASINKKD